MMSFEPSAPWDHLCHHFRETAIWESVQGLLEWDERTMMPPAAGAFRTEQVTQLSSLVHRRRTDPRVGQWLAELADSPLAADPHSDTGTTIRQLKREYEKRVKLPVALVEELTRATMQGQQAWVQARETNDFPAFAPYLDRILQLKREQAAALGFAEHPYDALLDDYEPGVKTSDIARVLGDLRSELAPLVAQVVAAQRRLTDDPLTHHYPQAAQESLGTAVAARLGFDFQRGRLDVTHHPFCSGVGPHDCRITTRYDERFFPQAFFGILHEAGHGIYDQGLRAGWYGLPPGTYVSLGIHESQSRMWENLVGRSHAFWTWLWPLFQERFPQASAGVARDDFYFAINQVRPSLIRVEADEATYNLHIIVRFELELALISDQLQVADLPEAWRGKYRHYLGIEPPDDASGVMQDIHWSAGLIGYFPTYSLGNLYASQFFETADRQLGGLAAQFSQGDFAPLRTWLRDHIHHPGQCYSAEELVVRVTGQPLSHAPLMTHLRQKLAPLYGL